MVVRRGLWWMYNKIVAYAQRCIISVLAAGPVPGHIAFVMDGNRRYARIHGKKVQQGHIEGFAALHSVWIDSLAGGLLSLL
jgi:ditrans,polycis-polyprenyl diphosphate synthase